MHTIKTRDEINIAYTDWGGGQPIVFSHGWPLNRSAWAEQMLFFASRGFRTIAHDRRGHGDSDESFQCNHIDVPVLVLHGDDDQIVPIAISALRSKELLGRAKLEVYPGASHGLTATHRERFNEDLLSFIRS